MIELMVTMAVIAVLIALLFPALSGVRESTRKIVCGSNMRQVGLGMSLYTQDWNDRLPNSVFLAPPRSNAVSYPSPERMDTVRLSSREFGYLNSTWDGLGHLYENDYVTAPSVFYCPSHKGNFQFEDATDQWAQLESDTELIVNYLYRGTGPDDSRVLYNIVSSAAMVTDTLRSYEDLNHEDGFNVLQAGLAVNWFNDVGDQISSDILLRSNDTGGLSSSVNDAWMRLDGLDEDEDPVDVDFDP